MMISSTTSTTASSTPLLLPRHETSHLSAASSTSSIKKKKTNKKASRPAQPFLRMAVLLGILTSLYLLVATTMVFWMRMTIEPALQQLHPPKPSQPQSQPQLLRNNDKNNNKPNPITSNKNNDIRKPKAVPPQLEPHVSKTVDPQPQQPQLQLLSTIQKGCVATADVRGNLGPPQTVLADADDNTDWLHHRWQAASNMHGMAIPGTHWLQLTWPATVELHSMVLHWETAFADHYAIQIWKDGDDSHSSTNNNDNWMTVLEAPQAIVQTTTSGHSPGVPASEDAPLHVIQTLSEFSSPQPLQQHWPQTTALRILMKHPGVHKGWGLSLWEVQVFGTPVVEKIDSS